MSTRSMNFKKNKFHVHNFNNLKSNKIYINNHKIDDYEEYSIIANIFCSILGLSKEDMKNFIKNDYTHKFDVLYTKNYVIKNKEKYERMMNSLSESFKAGEQKEHQRHLKEEDEAFKRGIKYGREQIQNEIKNNSYKEKEQVKHFETKKDESNIDKIYTDIDKTIQKCNEILSYFGITKILK